MRQELIDLLHGELAPDEERALRERLATDAELARELEELEGLLSLMKQGEQIEAPAALRAHVRAAAERAVRPTLIQQIKALPGLVRYRFRRSVAFRVAAISLGAHLILMAVLFHVSLKQRRAERRMPGFAWKPEIEQVQPDSALVARLKQRRLPHLVLRRVGIAGQKEAIEAGLDTILTRQKPDGTFGSPSETAYAALALLGEGDCSTSDTPRGSALRKAMRGLLYEGEYGTVHGAILTALVEDWVLSYERLGEQDRAQYARAMTRLIHNVGDDDASLEGLALARAAGLAVPKTRTLGIFDESVDDLIDRAPTRLSVARVLEGGRRHLALAPIKAWAKPLFDRAKAQIEAGKPSALAVLALQSPYRL